MSSLLPLATYNLALKPFLPAPAIDDDFPVTIRLTLAAVDPEAVDDKAEPSTLRLLKRSNAFIDDSEDEDDSENEDEEDELDDEEVVKKLTEDDEEEDDEEDNEEEDLDDEDGEVSEFIVCTLSPKVQFQQTIDITINPEEEVYFVVTGSYPIHLSGNYVEHPDDDEEDSEEDYNESDGDDDEGYDLTPDEDELAYDLDDLENASDVENKIEELVEEDSKKRSADEDASGAPTAKKNASKKAKKEEKKQVQFTKDLEQGPTGSTLVADKKETKKEKKEKAKKEAAAAVAKEAETKGDDVKDKKFPTKTLLGGVIAEDRKTGKGPQAKSGNKVGIRYIGKLKNGKVFDKNTSGKPFTFGLGKGECIKGFDLGVAGMAVGGERRVIIPAKMGYGSQALPGIPANSELTFDIKLVSIK